MPCPSPERKKKKRFGEDRKFFNFESRLRTRRELAPKNFL